ncbi:MAG: catalase [Actinomycetota bacterium]|jgi:catalase|nr:catalase [Actinomycetota bacterium]
MVGRVDDLGNRLVDAVLRDFPGHVEGTRPAHSKGIGVRGYFQPTEVAGDYCSAEHFRSRVPVTVRFSNSTGLMSVPDGAPDVRGMAVKFHLSGGAETDLIAITVPVFPAGSVEDSLSFLAAAVPAPVRPVSPLRRLIRDLTLRLPLPTPAEGETTSSAMGVFRFGVSHPQAEAGVLALFGAITPTSYARAAYHAIHAFRITAADGTVRSVRFHWEPVAGVRPVAEEDRPLADDYLQGEIDERLTGGPIEFVLRIQVAEIGDDTSDPTKPWPWRRRLVDMGRLCLSALVEDQIADCERLSFNPTRLVDGIAASDDEVLAARGRAYQASWERRVGSGCPVR